jgi:hypothetical protein
VLGCLALKHRPAVPPPILLPRTDVEVRRITPPTSVLPRALLFGFRRKFSTVVIDNDQMQPCNFEQTMEVSDPREPRIALRARDDLSWDSSTKRHLTLAEISKLARSAQIPIDSEALHVEQCVGRAGEGCRLTRCCGQRINPVDTVSTAVLSRMLCSAAMAGQTCSAAMAGQTCSAAIAGQSKASRKVT